MPAGLLLLPMAVRAQESAIRAELRRLANSPPVIGWQTRTGATRRPTATRRFPANDYGARGDGKTQDTTAIQAAIDACSAAGGGIVEFRPGRYVTGSLFLKSNVQFHLAKGVELLGAEDDEAFPPIHTRAGGIEMEWRAALLNVRDQRNVSVTGQGTIDGRGSRWWKKFWDAVPGYERKGTRWAADYDISRPHLVQIYESSDVTVEGLTLEDSPFWTVHIVFSRNVTIDGVTVRNNVTGKGPSTDGINIDSSAFVLVENCDVDCNDDNYSFKAGMNADGLRVNLPTEYSIFRHNIARRGMGAITFGSDMSGGIRHVEADDMQGLATGAGIRFKSARIRGGVVEDVFLHNIRLERVSTAIVADLNWFPQFSYPQVPAGRTDIPSVWRTLTTPVAPERAVPHFRRITIADVRATGSRTGIRVAGIPGAPMEKVVLKRIRIESARAGSVEYAKDWTIEDVSIQAEDGLAVVVKNSENVAFGGK
ncbi:MAG TPA: glycoside hydrolase family 28 protein [Candidatus Sulfopaludibacter sp.]|nr:glycoside hydrolase family 28 protein [Candidatus Sulfopaludibacter sp.]